MDSGLAKRPLFEVRVRLRWRAWLTVASWPRNSGGGLEAGEECSLTVASLGKRVLTDLKVSTNKRVVLVSRIFWSGPPCTSVLLCCLLIGSSLSSRLHGQVGEFRLSQPPLSPFIGLDPVETAGLDDPKAVRVVVSGQWTNWWYEINPGYERFAFIDYEGLSSRIQLAASPVPRLRLGLSLSERRHFGGVLDHLILGFHSALGLDTDGRDLEPRDQVRFEFGPDEPFPVRILPGETNGITSRNATATVELLLNPGARAWQYGLGLSVGKSWRLPEIVIRDSNDLAVSLRVTHRSGRRQPRSEARSTEVEGDAGASTAAPRGGRYGFHSRIDVIRSGTTGIGPLEVRRWQPALLLQGVRKGNHGGAFKISYRGAGGPLPEFDIWSRPSHELTLSWWRGSDSYFYELGVTENLFNQSNGPDFGLSAVFGWGF